MSLPISAIAHVQSALCDSPVADGSVLALHTLSNASYASRHELARSNFIFTHKTT